MSSEQPSKAPRAQTPFNSAVKETPGNYISLSTKEIGSSQRLDYWNSILDRTYPGMSAFSVSQDIHAIYCSRRVGDIHVAFLNAQEKSRIHRWQSVPPEPEGARTLAQIQCEGTSITFSEAEAGLINTGDLKFGRSDVPYSVNLSERNSVILIDFPSAFLSFATPSEGKLITRSGSVKKLHKFALSVLANEFADLGGEDNSDECISDAFATLLQQCAEIKREDGTDNVILLRRTFEFIEGSLWDSTLRTNTIAKHLSVSGKQVQRLFATLGMTPSQFILNRRINLAAYMLRSSFDGTVTDLAMDVGFSDAAHFCRRFRRILGLTPTEYARLQRRR